MYLHINKPDGLDQSSDYRVTVHVPGREEELYCAYATVRRLFKDNTMFHEKMSFCSVDWDFSSPVTITIIPAREWNDVCIRPRHAKIPYTIDGGTVVITLDKPHKFSVEFDGDLYRNLFVYVCLPVTVPRGEKVRVFGPGTHDIGRIHIDEGEIVYIDGEATVFGYIEAKGDHIRVCGHGVITAAKENHDVDKSRVHLFHGSECNDLQIEGIIMLDSPTWTLCLEKCRDVEITDLKQICFNNNSDGFDICSCSKVHINNCFVRNWDDNISIKARSEDNRDILMENCILWADCAHNMLIGPESGKEAENHFCHIAFRNIDVLEHKELCDFYMGVMAIFCADNASFYDIEWDGIRIERMTYGRIFDCNYVSVFAETYGKSVRNIRMKNIDCYAPIVFKSRIRGLDEYHIMEDFLLENIRINGIPVRQGEPSIEIGKYVKNIIIR